MKSYFIILSFLAIMLLGFNKPSTFSVTINGHIKNNPKDTSWALKHLRIFVKGDNKILAKTFTDNSGNFKLTFTPKNEKSFDFYCTTFNADTLLIGSLTSFISDNPGMTFFVPLIPELNKSGNIICPKCKKADKVIDAIVYARPPGFDTLARAGLIDTISIRTGNLYCMRDKVRF